MRMISPEKITVTLSNNRVQPLTKEDKENKLYVPSNGRDESYERLKQSLAMSRRVGGAHEDSSGKWKESNTQAAAAVAVERIKKKEQVNETDENLNVMVRRREVECDRSGDGGLAKHNVDVKCGEEEEEEETDNKHSHFKSRRSSESATNSSASPRSRPYHSSYDKSNDAVKQWLGSSRVQDNSTEKLSQETDPDSEPVLEICQNMSELEAEEPEFVVTLNGFSYSCLSDEDEHLPLELEHETNSDLQHTKNRSSSANIVIQPQDSNLSSDAVESKQTPVAKSLERCRFWPNCLLGDKCSFIHPTTMCKMFPACKYGDQCLFVHPACKFGVACTRRDCTFKHPPVLAKAKVSVMSGSAATLQNCRFFPNCSNPTCPFFHPKPCRFGNYCTKKNCLFDHSMRHSKDKLKWIRTE